MNEQTLFAEALERTDRQDRAAFLEQACQGDPVLRERIERLLAQHQHAGAFLESPAAPSGATLDEPITEQPGAVIGPYKLLEMIGEGGFGVVFMAEQSRPLRRKVALKILKAGMETPLVTARFEAERQALALMDHPNIAKVLDGGATASGRPYFVMELIKGVPITEFCDQNHLTPRQRLELFIPVCLSIQHAHQKGIIHRDLKPSNVLVTVHDTVPVVKVIDFGVAKALVPELTEKTLFTGFAQLIGTPLYMSPEQAGRSSLDVDTRSDIYSLGVLLYELLTGTTPFERGRFNTAAYDEICRIIREEEPPKPSTRLRTTEELPSIAANRGLPPKKLNGALRADLDWIVMKCLEKDRNRRYETANSIAVDLQRYLSNQVVQAGPPSAVYRLRKFLRRHQLPVIAASFVLIALVGGTTVSIIQAARAMRAERSAIAAQRTSRANEANALIEKRRAQESAAEARSVLAFFQANVLEAGRPKDQHGGLGINITIREALVAAEPQIGTRFKDQPLVEAAIRSALGETYWYLGEPQQAIAQHERARELRSALLGPDHPNTLASMHSLAIAYVRAGRLTEAIELYEATLRQRERRLGPEHLATLQTMNNLASAYSDAGRLAQAVPLCEQTVRLLTERFGTEHCDTLGSMHNLAVAYSRLGRQREALPLFERTLKLRSKVLGPENPDTLQTMNNLASAYSDAGRLADAVQLCEQTVELRRSVLGPEHPDTLSTMHNLAVAYVRAGRWDAAVPLYEQTLKLRRQRLGPKHPEALRSMNNLGSAYVRLGRQAEGLALCEETFELRRSLLGPDHPDTLSSMHNLAIAFVRGGRLTEALPLYEQTLKLRRMRLGPLHPDTLQSMNNLASAYRDAGRLADALALYEQTLNLRRDQLGADHPDTLVSMHNLGLAYARDGRFAEALPLYEATLRLRRKQLGADHPDTRKVRTDLVNACRRTNDHRRIARIAEATCEAFPDDPKEYHWAAHCLTICARLAGTDSNLAQTQRIKTAAEYQLRARDMLKEAICRGASVFPGVLEAELLENVHATDFPVEPQWMDPWGAEKWSNAFQLVCRAKQGGYVTFEINLPSSGTYCVELYFTKAPDNGIVEVAIDDVVIGKPFDGYSPTIMRSGKVGFGSHNLAAGSHRVRLTAIGKNPDANHSFIGIDCLMFDSVADGR